MQLQDLLHTYSAAGKAILAANFYNFETLSGILQAAKQKKAPVILQLSESSIRYMGVKTAAGMARNALEQSGVTGWIHLDHGNSVDLVHACLDAGFDSVMIDASEKSYSENIRITAEVVQLAGKYNANVEAELGYIAKLGQEQEIGQFTQPAEAKAFVEATGVNALAIAIGSAHGFYTSPPNLQLDLLQKIHTATPAALVLHGGSGIPADQLRAAIKCGITKVNVATETKNAFMGALQSVLMNNKDIDLRVVFPKATQSVVDIISEKLSLLNVD